MDYHQGRDETSLVPLGLWLKGTALTGAAILWVLFAQVPMMQGVDRFPWEGLFALVGTSVAGYYAYRTTTYINDRKKDDVINDLEREIDILKLKIEYMEKSGEHDHTHDKVKHLDS